MSMITIDHKKHSVAAPTILAPGAPAAKAKAAAHTITGPSVVAPIAVGTHLPHASACIISSGSVQTNKHASHDHTQHQPHHAAVDTAKPNGHVVHDHTVHRVTSSAVDHGKRAGNHGPSTSESSCPSRQEQHSGKHQSHSKDQAKLPSGDRRGPHVTIDSAVVEKEAEANESFESAIRQPQPNLNKYSSSNTSGQEAKISQIISLFKQIDSNGDGTIDRSELMRLMWSLDSNITEKEMGIVFDTADVDHDGAVSYEEFVQWIYADGIANKLKVVSTPKHVKGKGIKFTVVYIGKTLSLTASMTDTVKDLRFRVLEILKLSVDQLHYLRMRYKSTTTFLKDAQSVTELSQDDDLEVILDNVGSLFGAASYGVGQWRADTVEQQRTLSTPSSVKLLCYCEESHVVVAVVGKEGDICAFSTANGKPKWNASLKSDVACLACHRQTVFGGTECGSLIALDSQTGRKLWKMKPHGNVASLQVLAYVDQLGLVCAGAENGNLYAWNSRTGKEVWSARQGDDEPEVSNLVGSVSGETLFSGGGGGRVIAWNAKTGKQHWKVKVEGPVASIFYRETYDTLCVADSNKIYSLEGSSGKILFSEELKGARIVRGRLQNMYVATAHEIVAWDTLNGNMQWQVNVPGGPRVEDMHFAEEVEALCVGTTAGLLIIDALNGRQRGEARCDHGVAPLVYVPVKGL